MTDFISEFNTRNTPVWVGERIEKAKEQKSKELDLSWPVDQLGEKLVSFPAEIQELLDLQVLNFSGNRLTKLPDSIAHLPNLTSLDLSSNELRTLPDSLSHLSNLTYLNVSHNKIRTLPDSILHLQNLISLDLGYNLLNILPEQIHQLQNLIILDLCYNGLSILPEWFSQLHNLRSLDLSKNGFSTLPEWFSQLQNLTNLNMSYNFLSALPASFGRLENLKSLDLSHNHLRRLPDAVSKLHYLRSLNLINNGITTLPKWVIQLQSLTRIELEGNPLTNPPIEVAHRGMEPLREYFRQLEQEGVDYLYEAKLLLLGEGGAGKTSLAKKILDSDYVLKDEDSTKGIDVLKWSFSIEPERQFNVNIWDFGGQEIYHATHQFFLTQRSLYVLVADTRKDDTDFYYWLNIADLLSDHSPLLIVKNEKQDRHREINERQLKAEFDNLKEVLATNLANNSGLEEVKQEIQHQIKKLSHVGTQLPKTWVRLREQLEKDLRNYITLEEYLWICSENGFTKIEDALQLSTYLNDIGVILHFQHEPLLKKVVILKPKWATAAVYKLLDDPTIMNNRGTFSRSHLGNIWDAPEYKDMLDELLRLMMKFKLCYEIPTEEWTYIAPQLLTENQPDYEWDDQSNLLLRYSYEFMPKGILSQLIVVIHRYILEQRYMWKNGVVIEKDQTRAEVIEYYSKREIHVRIAGRQTRDLMTIIRHELKQIHDTYKRLKYDEKIPCNCSSCSNADEPYFYTIAVLLEFRANNQLEIQCQKKPYEMVNVLRLLGDFIDLSKLSEGNSSSSIYVAGDYFAGGKVMNEKNISISDSTIMGSVVVADNIRDSLNIINNSHIQEELKDQLQQLALAVDTMVKGLQKEQAEEIADDMKRLAEEVTKAKPNPKWYNVSINGLIAAAQNVGKVGAAVLDLAIKVRTTLDGGML
jgi:internalin A